MGTDVVAGAHGLGHSAVGLGLLQRHCRLIHRSTGLGGLSLGLGQGSAVLVNQPLRRLVPCGEPRDILG